MFSHTTLQDCMNNLIESVKELKRLNGEKDVSTERIWALFYP